jgi:hypothetical protein
MGQTHLLGVLHDQCHFLDFPAAVSLSVEH